jgi:2-polyprenyl-3-methyl-5-hydroxy-6-metoxy-1,4-benzoquinol methylase
VIWKRIADHVSSPDDVLDFGAGRGWFLEQRPAGVVRLAGADTSAMAVEDLRARGMEGLQLPLPTALAWELPLDRLSFRPRIVTLLDVIEHFPAGRLSAMFGHIVGSLRPELELVVVKVPVADGILYRIARVLAAIGVAGPLNQLYQVGTEPPHQSYFTRRSLDLFLTSHALHSVARIGLTEFDPDSLGARVGALRRVPRGITKLVGAVLAWVAKHTWQDSYVVLARFDAKR